MISSTKSVSDSLNFLIHREGPSSYLFSFVGEFVTKTQNPMQRRGLKGSFSECLCGSSEEEQLLVCPVQLPLSSKDETTIY